MRFDQFNTLIINAAITKLVKVSLINDVLQNMA